MDTEKVWLVEWSEKQQAFHVNRADLCISQNIEQFLSPKGGDWIVLGLFASQIEANDAKKLFKQTRFGE